jgi:hypothetical protein
MNEGRGGTASSRERSTVRHGRVWSGDRHGWSGTWPRRGHASETRPGQGHGRGGGGGRAREKGREGEGEGELDRGGENSVVAGFIEGRGRGRVGEGEAGGQSWLRQLPPLMEGGEVGGRGRVVAGGFGSGEARGRARPRGHGRSGQALARAPTMAWGRGWERLEEGEGAGWGLPVCGREEGEWQLGLYGLNRPIRLGFPKKSFL